MRLNRRLALNLGISRRAADKLIIDKQVTVNGLIAQVGLEVKDNDSVMVNQLPLIHTPDYKYLLLNKPTGYVCSRNGQGAKTIYDLLPIIYKNLKPVGRLDKDSSGLLMMTNDGQLHNQLTHPSFIKVKIYHVSLNKPLTNQDKIKIESGKVKLTDGISKFKIQNIRHQLKIQMSEGRNRQIRRTFSALGYEVKTLERTQFGNYRLGDLKAGHFKLIQKSTTD